VSFQVDRNGNGDLTEPGEHVAWRPKHCREGLVTSPDGERRYRLSLRNYPNGTRLTVMTGGTQRFMVGDSGQNGRVKSLSRSRRGIRKDHSIRR
jgi:hypothetical protein